MRWSLVWLCLLAFLLTGCHGKKSRRSTLIPAPACSSATDSDFGSGGGNGDVVGGGGEDDGDDGGGGGGGDEPPDATQDCDYSAVDEDWHPGVDPVWYFNAQFEENWRTVRWKNGVIKVKVFDGRVDLVALQAIFDELNPLIHPAKLQVFTGDGNHDIEIAYNENLDINNGLAAWNLDLDKHYITFTLIELGDFDSTDCYFYAVLKHHLIRSLGFFNYTENGAVMDEDVPNDHVTMLVAETLILLYDLQPGTEMTPEGPADD